MGATATAMRAERPEAMMPGTYMRPRQAKKATVAAVATVRDARASMRARRFDTAALMERMPSHFDVREAVMVNAFIASCVVALGGIQEPPCLRFRIRPCVYKKKHGRHPLLQHKMQSLSGEQIMFGWRPCRPDMSGPTRGSVWIVYGHKKRPGMYRALTDAPRDRLTILYCSTAKLGKNFGLCKFFVRFFQKKAQHLSCCA